MKWIVGLVFVDFVVLFFYVISVVIKCLINRVIEGLGFGVEIGSLSWFLWKLEEYFCVFGVKFCMKDFEDLFEIF